MHNANFLRFEPRYKKQSRIQWVKVIVGGALFAVFGYLLYLFLSYVIPIFTEYYDLPVQF
jgi:hypothetical protein